jgi:hypothetical protein
MPRRHIEPATQHGVILALIACIISEDESRCFQWESNVSRSRMRVSSLRILVRWIPVIA